MTTKTKAADQPLTETKAMRERADFVSKHGFSYSIWGSDPPTKGANLWERMLWITTNAATISKDAELAVGSGAKVPVPTYDAMIRALKPLMGAAGVYLRIEIDEFTYETVRTANDKPTNWNVVKGTATFINTEEPKDQDVRVVRGAALNNSDKGLSAATTYLRKTALKDAFLLDAGSEDPDVGPSQEIGGDGPQPRGPQRTQQASRSGRNPDSPPDCNVRPIPLTAKIPMAQWAGVAADWHSGKRITKPQQVRLYTVASKEGGWNDAQVKEVLIHHFGLASSSEIPGDWDARGMQPYSKIIEIFSTFSPEEVGPEDQSQDGPDQTSFEEGPQS